MNTTFVDKLTVVPTDWLNEMNDAVYEGKLLWCGTATGTANAITLISTPSILGYSTGQRFSFKSSATNTGATTVAISPGVATAIQVNGSACVGGEIVTGNWYQLLFDGAAFQLKDSTTFFPVASVKNFGAKGDGVTNDTAAIQAAHAASTNVYYPKGTYLVSGTSNLAQYVSTNDISITFDEATITYGSQVFNVGVVWDMFQFKTCERVDIRGMVKLQGTFTSGVVGPAASPYGPFGFHFYFRQRNVSIDTVVADGILMPVMFERQPAAKAAAVASIGAGGAGSAAGYSANDILTITGGIPTTATQIKVLTVDGGGGILTTTIQTQGLYPNTGGPNNYDVNIPTVLTTDNGMSVTGGTGSGAKFNIFWEDADTSTRAENIDIRMIYATNCFYPCQFSQNGYGVRIGEIVTDFTHRSLLIVGTVEHLIANVTFRHHSDDAVCLSSLSGFAPRDIELKVRFLPPTQANYCISNGAASSKVRFNWASSVPGKFEDIRLVIDGHYGVGPDAVAGRGANALIIIKEDAKGRGRQFNGLTVAGQVDGFGDIDGGSGLTHLMATGTAFVWSAAPLDAFKDFTIWPFINNSTLDFLWDQNLFSQTRPTTRFIDLPETLAGSPTFIGNVIIGGGGLGGSLTMGNLLILKRQTPAYSASVPIVTSGGNEFDITVTNGTAFTVTNPDALRDGMRITITIRNAAGGALGAVTWDTLYKLSAWTQPANGFSRSIDFKCNGTNWVQVSQTGVDVPN